MKRPPSNEYNTEFAFDYEFDDYGPFSKSHPFRLYKYEKNDSKKQGTDKKENDELSSEK